MSDRHVPDLFDWNAQSLIGRLIRERHEAWWRALPWYRRAWLRATTPIKMRLDYWRLCLAEWIAGRSFDE